MSFLEVAASVLTVTLLLASLLGLLVRFVLMPYLKEHLIAPIKETNKQVTVNHHSSEQPTVLDRIDDVAREVRDARAEVAALGRMFDGHLDWSEREVADLWEQISQHHRHRHPRHAQEDDT